METELNSLVEAAMEISAKQSRLMLRIREAFERGEDAEAMMLARELVGLYDGPTERESRCDTLSN